jgi:hypothetical protein
VAFTPDLPLPRFEFRRKAHSVSRSELCSVAWYQPQGAPEVLYEVALSHFIPSRNSPAQVHEAPGIDASGWRLPVDQSREDRECVSLTLDFKDHSWWHRYELREALCADIHSEALPKRWQHFCNQFQRFRSDKIAASGQDCALLRG